MQRTVLIALILGLACAAGLWALLGPEDAGDAVPDLPSNEAGDDEGMPEDPTTGGTDSQAPVPPPGPPVDEQVREALRRILSADPGEGNPLDDPRWATLLEDPEATGLLIRTARGSGDLDERTAALLLLGRSPLPEAGDLLVAAANGDLGIDLETASILALGQVDHRVSHPVLADIAIRSRDPELATTALRVLLSRDVHGGMEVVGRIMERAEEQPERRIAVYRLLSESVPEPGAGLSGRYQLFLAPPVEPLREGGAHTEDAVRTVLTRIESDLAEGGDRAMRETAMGALVRLGGEDAAAAFGRALSRAGPEEQIHMMGRINPLESPGMLREAYRLAPECEEEVRRHLTGFLIGLPLPEFLPYVRKWRAMETDREIRQRLDEAIRLMEDQ
jgi:hypothetical protein